MRGSLLPPHTPSRPDVQVQGQLHFILQGKAALLLMHQIIKTYGVVKVRLHAFLTTTLNGAQCHISVGLPWVKNTHQTGNWVGP
jgi:hypothetical protein